MKICQLSVSYRDLAIRSRKQRSPHKQIMPHLKIKERNLPSYHLQF